MVKKVNMKIKKLFTGKMNLELKKENNEVLALECNATCSRDVDIDSDRRLEAFEMWIRRRMEKNRWLDKVTNE